VLAGFDQPASSRSTSYGHGTPTGDEAAGGSAGGSIGIVRRAARRGTRGTDQSYASGGYSGYGNNGGYGTGTYGSAFGQVGPLGFAPSERTGGKQGKGLRHFSMKVCEKVESKGTTTYNEVADELVEEMKHSQQEDGVVYDEKNIRRRVYDAINVLMALDVIAKEKKAIIWRGFHAGVGGGGGIAGGASSNSLGARPAVGAGAIARAQEARAAAAAAVDKKAAFLADLLEQQRALKALMTRNAAAPAVAPNGTQLDLPFILVQAKPDATVEVQVGEGLCLFGWFSTAGPGRSDWSPCCIVIHSSHEPNKKFTAPDRACAPHPTRCTPAQISDDMRDVQVCLACHFWQHTYLMTAVRAPGAHECNPLV
jgi:hypothetical protein